MVKRKEVENVEDIKDEVSVEEFMRMSERGSKIDYEEVWNRVNGKILSSKGLEKVVSEIRGSDREFYWSEKNRVFKIWKEKGRMIEERIGFVGNRRRKFYKFSE